MNFILSISVGCALGILAAFGIGGGTLLMLYMTLVAGIAQTQAQCINLLYFIPTAVSALYCHIKNKLIDCRTVIYSAASGVLFAVASAFAATAIDTAILRKIFGGFLIITGAYELFAKLPKK